MRPEYIRYIPPPWWRRALWPLEARARDACGCARSLAAHAAEALGDRAALLRALAAARRDLEQERVRLAGCSVAALGWDVAAGPVPPGGYGWSQSYADVVALRQRYEALRVDPRVQAVVALSVERDALRAGLESLARGPHARAAGGAECAAGCVPCVASAVLGRAARAARGDAEGGSEHG